MSASEQPLVVIIDDDRAMRHSFIVLLDCCSYELETYATAEEFLDQCDLSRVHCLILDMRLPGASGLELLQALDRDRIKIPVIATTGYGDDETERRIKELGAVALFEKPFDGDKLIETIDRILLEEPPVS